MFVKVVVEQVDESVVPAAFETETKVKVPHEVDSDRGQNSSSPGRILVSQTRFGQNVEPVHGAGEREAHAPDSVIAPAGATGRTTG